MTASASGAKRASRLTSNPDHNNGIVNASGSRCVCRSIQASASKAATNPYAASACPLAPKRQNALAALIALRSSINKYRIGIGAQKQRSDRAAADRRSTGYFPAASAYGRTRDNESAVAKGCTRGLYPYE